MFSKETYTNPRMKKMLVFLAILFGLIFGWKMINYILFKRFMASAQKPAQTVSTIKVKYTLWQPQLKSVGSLRATVGVNVTTELAGLVKNIYFTPGAHVTKGTVLIQLNADTELGQLHALQAQTELAKITYKRDKAQYAVLAVSKQQLDTDEWNLKNLIAQTEQQAATVEKKTIRAPFTGRLGISSVNPGQYLNVGNTVTTLQTLDPIYVDFYLPQQSLSEIKIGQTVKAFSDAYKNKSFQGKVTTIEPLVDTNTRNVKVEATLENPDEILIPGMYASVEIITGTAEKFLTLPQTAVSFNPYGEVIFIVEEKGKNEKGEPQYIARQKFVTTGLTRGDQIQVLSGVKEGEIVVTSGQLKLQNDTPVIINNTVQPANNPAPVVTNRN